MRIAIIDGGMKNAADKIARRIRVARRARRVETDARRIRRGAR